MNEGCVDRDEWLWYEERAMAWDRLSALKVAPLASVEEFAQACKEIRATAPEPASLYHRAKTLEHIVNEWSQLMPSSDFEYLHAALVHTYKVALAEEGLGHDLPDPLVYPDVETEETVAGGFGRDLGNGMLSGLGPTQIVGLLAAFHQTDSGSVVSQFSLYGRPVAKLPKLR